MDLDDLLEELKDERKVQQNKQSTPGAWGVSSPPQ